MKRVSPTREVPSPSAPQMEASDRTKPLLTVETNESMVLSPIQSKRMQVSPGTGQLILKKVSSIAFYIDLISPTKSPMSTTFEKPKHKLPSNLFFPRIALHHMRPPPQEMHRELQQSLHKANQRRQQFLQQRQHKLRSQVESVRLRVLIQKSRERLNSMRMQAKQEYAMSSAALKRHMFIRAKQERWAAIVERANTVALMQRMKKFLELRKAVSDGILDVLKHDKEHGTDYGAELDDTTDLMRGLRVDLNDQLDTAIYDIPESEDNSTVYASPERENNSSPVKGSRSSPSYLFNLKDTPVERLSATIKRSKSVPLHVLDEPDDFLVMEIMSLLPSINRFTLRELDLDEILSNAQLRHDLVFDPDLKFKPNTEQDESAQEKIDAYWEEVEKEMQSGQLYRIPLLMGEIRAILVELLPSGTDQKDEIYQNIEPKMISQQIEHGIMDPKPLIGYLAKLIKTNCAPIRDPIVDEMVQECQNGNITRTMKLLFEIMELMKLVFLLTVGLCQSSDFQTVTVYPRTRD
ncbi:T-complex protein 11-domain-containing protein [Gorgonomyces haynaldii]|nr:T-complex protein 11-domain-containing protein [Gorgonomyces haynaldii]